MGRRSQVWEATARDENGRIVSAGRVRLLCLTNLVFALDETAYTTDALYPQGIAETGKTYTYRGEQKLQVLFHPFAYNPVTRELVQRTKIRIRLDYREASRLKPLALPSGLRPRGTNSPF